MRLERHYSLQSRNAREDVSLKFGGMIPPSFANHPTPRQARDHPSLPAARGFALGVLVVVSERDGNNSYFLRCRLAPFLPALPPARSRQRRNSARKIAAVYNDAARNGYGADCCLRYAKLFQPLCHGAPRCPSLPLLAPPDIRGFVLSVRVDIHCGFWQISAAPPTVVCFRSSVY